VTDRLQVALSRKSAYVETSHKVSGLMLANHTCMHSLFAKIVKQYDQIRRKNAFIDNYRCACYPTTPLLLLDGLPCRDEGSAFLLPTTGAELS
jgi:hypothetical protein